MLRFFESLESQIAGNGGEPLKKLLDSFSTFEIVEQSLDRHARTTEDGYPVHDFRIANDRLRHSSIVSQTATYA
jgi:hypothetical protein